MTRFGGVSVGSSRTRVVRIGTAAGLALVLGIVPLGTTAAIADDATPTGISTTTPPATPPPTPSSASTTSASSETTTTSPAPDATTSTSPTSTKTSQSSLTPQAATSDAAVPLAVPPATGNDAVITVKVGGNRLTTAAVAGLAGVTLTLYDGSATAPTTPATGIGTNTCVSDAAGDCSWIIPNTQTGPPAGANLNRQFWVVQTGVPGGWLQNSSLITGPDGGPFGPTPYRFRTGTSLVAGNTYSSGGSFMLGTGNTVPTASGGIWQNTRVNPVAPTKCGLNVALVLDVSGSVAGSLPALKTAATTFTNALVGTPSSLALFTFAATAPANATNNQNRPLTPVSTQAGADVVNGWINGVTAGGTTNWDRGLFQVQQSTSQFDIAVVITDGNPTVYGNTEGPGDYTRFREVENGIFSANAVKAENTRMLAFGVGAGISAGAANLAAISGPTANSDYFQTSNYAEVGTILKNLALGSCTGSVTVVKQVVPNTAPAGSIIGAVPAGGWTFGATTTASGVTIAPPSGATATGTGALNFNLTFPGGTTTAPVAAVETQQSGFTLQPVGGFNAVCTRPDTGASVPVTNSGALGFTVDANIAYGVTCTVYNRAPNPPVTVVVNKQWAITDTTSGVTTTYANGTQPSDLQAALTLNGSPQAFGTTRTGFVRGDPAVIAESVTNGLRGCVLGTPTMVKVPGGANLGVPYTATLTEGENSFLITNPVTCTTRLTLVKTVTSGPAAPTAWDLSATAASGAAAGPAGTTGVTGLVTPGARYTLAEAGGDPRYVQRAGSNAVPIPGSTVSWQCVEIDANGNVIPGFADGLNGGVVVFIGLSVRCTAVNDTAQLVLRKAVVNDNGGTATPDQWSLTATPQAPVFPGVTATTVTGSTAGASIWLRPGQAYRITETGPGGYTQTDFECTIGQTRSTDPLITLAANELGDCTFTNDDQPAKLTLEKIVDPAASGSGKVPGDWTLTATPVSITGQGPVSGTGDPTKPGGVNQVIVFAGSYALSESVVAGFTAGDWSCTGGTYTPATKSVAVPSGGTVVCTITNTAVAPKLTLVKKVDNGTTGATTQPTAWTLTGTGPTTITGVTGSSAVTAAAAKVGKYTLSESTTPSGYTASAWVCTGGAATDSTSVTLVEGNDATCTITNTAIVPTLTLKKVVDNGSTGATAVPADFSLTAVNGASTISGPGNSGGVTDQNAIVGTYALSETGPAGYAATAWTCDGGSASTPTSVTLAPGSVAVCTITNTAQQSYLTLVKTVTNDNGGTAVPSGWNLVAAGPTAFTAKTGVRTPVAIGDYTVSEADGPDGYQAGEWTCSNNAGPGDTTTIALGDDVTCTINNDDIAGTWTISKASDPVSGTTVKPGDVITYTVTARKLAGVDRRGVVVSDDLSNVLNNATLLSGPTPSTGTATVTGTTMTWTIPDLAGTETVTYQVKVNAGANGVTIGNVVTSPGSNPCVPETTEQPTGPALVRALLAPAALPQLAAEAEDCTTTTHDTRAWSLVKSSDPASGATVSAGSTVTYTLTATNTYTPPVTGAMVVDDLSAVLKYGTLVAVPDGATLIDTFLTWNVPDLNAKGDTATLTYQVKLNADAFGVTVKNVATPGPGGSCPAACSTSHTTPPQGVTPPDLPKTGADLLPVLWWAGVLLLLGVVALLTTRRRREVRG